MPTARPSRRLPALPRGTLALDRREQIELLCSPVRQEIVDTLGAEGWLTVADLARALGRAPDALYYHLRILEKGGLIVREEELREDGRTESIVALAARRLAVRYDAGRPGRVELLGRAVDNLLRLTGRDFRSALQDDRCVFHGARRNARAARRRAWLDADQHAELLGHLDAIDALLNAGRRRPGTKLQALSLALVPLRPSDRERDTSDAS